MKKTQGTVGQDGFCSPGLFLWHIIIKKKKKKLMPQDLMVCTTNTVQGQFLYTRAASIVMLCFKRPEIRDIPQRERSFLSSPVVTQCHHLSPGRIT